MELSELLFKNEIEWIKNTFTEKGWITIYHHSGEEYPRTLVYPCLVKSSRIKSYRLDTDWGLHPGSEGKPSIVTTYRNGRGRTQYHSNAEKGLEPFIFSKSFRFAEIEDEKYIDLSEEFVLYFKLFERSKNKQNRTFYFVDENGELEEVVKIDPNNVKVKKKFILEFISIRKMYLAICFDCMIIEKGTLSGLGISGFDEKYVRQSGQTCNTAIFQLTIY